MVLLSQKAGGVWCQKWAHGIQKENSARNSVCFNFVQVVVCQYSGQSAIRDYQGSYQAIGQHVCTKNAHLLFPTLNGAWDREQMQCSLEEILYLSCFPFLLQLDLPSIVLSLKCWLVVSPERNTHLESF